MSTWPKFDEPTEEVSSQLHVSVSWAFAMYSEPCTLVFVVHVHVCSLLSKRQTVGR